MKIFNLCSIVVIGLVVCFGTVTSAGQSAAAERSVSQIQLPSDGQWRPEPCDPAAHAGKCGKNIWMSYDEAFKIGAEGLIDATVSHVLIEKRGLKLKLLLRRGQRIVLVKVTKTK